MNERTSTDDSRSELRDGGQEDERNKVEPVRPELEPRSRTRTLRKERPKKENPARVLVRVTSVRRRLIDEDNLCEKYVVDCLRYAGLLHADSPGAAKIEATQRKAGKEEDEHTLIELFDL